MYVILTYSEINYIVLDAKDPLDKKVKAVLEALEQREKENEGRP